MLITGGSGLHFRALVDPMSFAPTDPELRAELEEQPLEDLVSELRDTDPEVDLHVDLANRRRVIGRSRSCGSAASHQAQRASSAEAEDLRRYVPEIEFTAVGIDPGDALEPRVEARLKAMRAGGLVEEVTGLRDRLGRTARKAVGYREILDALDGLSTIDEAFEKAARSTRQLARRQRTWFQRDPRIRWIPWLDDLAESGGSRPGGPELSGMEFTKMQGLGNDFVVIEGPARLTVDEVTATLRSAARDRRRRCPRDLAGLTDRHGLLERRRKRRGDVRQRVALCRALRPRPGLGHDRRVRGRYAGRVAPGPDRRRPVAGRDGAASARGRGNGRRQRLSPGRHRQSRMRFGLSMIRPRSMSEPSARSSLSRPGSMPAATSSSSRSSDDVVTMRVWERGVGETLACGTGMAAAAAVALKGADGSVTVEVPGGTGSVEIRDGIAWLTGPAEYSFRGVWDQG